MIQNNQAGLTLVEIMTVLVVISIIALFAAPEVMNWRPNMRLTDAARTFFSEVQQAKVEAVKENCRSMITVDTTAGTYSIFLDNGDGGGTSNDGTRNGAEPYISLDRSVDPAVPGVAALPQDVTFDAPSTKFADSSKTSGFNSRGITLTSKDGDVVLKRTDESRWYKIHIDTAGSITMQRKTSKTGSWE